MKPSFIDVYLKLISKNQAKVVSSKGTQYTVKAGTLTKGRRKGEKAIIANLRSGKIYIHQDCWGQDLTCQGTRASGLYEGNFSLFDWYHTEEPDQDPKEISTSLTAPPITLSWNIDGGFVDSILTLYRNSLDKPFVKHRIEKNINNPPHQIDKHDAWFGIIACLVTTQQRSGPNSKVTQLLSTKPFPLSYHDCISSDRPQEFFRDILSKRGIRRSNVIAREIVVNLEKLEHGEWKEFLGFLNGLIDSDNSENERRAANYIKANFKGFGPKQSRNLLQTLGLSKYEIPIDSRITNWLKEIGFPIPLSAMSLADENNYQLISDGIQEISKKAGLFPCVLDAIHCCLIVSK